MLNEPVTAEIFVAASPADAWKALTNPASMKQWYFELDHFEPREGFTFEFDGGTEQRTYRHFCKVLEAKENKLLKHTWKYVGYAGNSTVTWQIDEAGDKTRVKVVHEGLETFPGDNDDFAKSNFKEGWHYIVESSLKKYLDSESDTE